MTNRSRPDSKKLACSAERSNTRRAVSLCSPFALALGYDELRTSENTDQFIQDIRQRVIGAPEISTDGYHPYRNAIRDAFVSRAAHGTITKTYSVTHLAVNEASRRYSPAAVIAVERDVVNGAPAQISTSLVERSHLTLWMSCRRFGRLAIGSLKRIALIR